ELFGKRGSVARGGRGLCETESARRRWVRRRVASGGDAREEEERVRRFSGRGGVSHRAGLYEAGETRDRRRLKRGPARGGGDHATTGAVRGGPAGSRRYGHAAVPQIHDWVGLGHRVRLGGQRGAVPVSLPVLAVA